MLDFPSSPANGSLYKPNNVAGAFLYDGVKHKLLPGWRMIQGAADVGGSGVLNLPLPAGYSTYRLVVGGWVPPSNTSYLILRVSFDGSTYLSTAIYYYTQQRVLGANVSDYAANTAGTQFPLTYAGGPGITDQGLSSVLDVIIHPGNIAAILAVMHSYDNAQGDVTALTSGYVNQLGRIQAIRLMGGPTGAIMAIAYYDLLGLPE